MTRLLATLGLGLALSVPARPAAESLGFEVYWGGMVVGRARIETLPTTDTSQFLLRTTARANNAIQRIYPVRDTVESWVTSLSGYPLRFQKRLSEGSYSAAVRIDFDRSKAIARIQGGQKKGGTPDTSVALPAATHDLLSAFHAVRRSALVPGTSLHLDILDNRKVFRDVEVACLRRETLDVEGTTWKTVVIEPKIHGDALFKSKGKLWVWLTDDERHMPVQMVSEISLGTIKAVLVSHTP